MIKKTQLDEMICCRQRFDPNESIEPDDLPLPVFKEISSEVIFPLLELSIETVLERKCLGTRS